MNTVTKMIGDCDFAKDGWCVCVITLLPDVVELAASSTRPIRAKLHKGLTAADVEKQVSSADDAVRRQDEDADWAKSPLGDVVDEY